MAGAHRRGLPSAESQRTAPCGRRLDHPPRRRLICAASVPCRRPGSGRYGHPPAERLVTATDRSEDRLAPRNVYSERPSSPLSCRPGGPRLGTCLSPLSLTHAYIATGLRSPRASSPLCGRGTLAPAHRWGTLGSIFPAVRVRPHRRGFFFDPSGRSRPSRRRDARSDAAHQRQTGRQVSRGDGLVTVISRDLRYPPDWPRRSAEEKGIDVALAVDFRTVADPTDYTHSR